MNNSKSFDQTVSAEVLAIAREVFEEDIVAAAERIFGVKAEPMTPEQIRQFELARRYNALVYQALPTKNGKVGIVVVVEAKKQGLDKS